MLGLKNVLCQVEVKRKTAYRVLLGSGVMILVCLITVYMLANWDITA